jgi:hypothetical protein
MVLCDSFLPPTPDWHLEIQSLSAQTAGSPLDETTRVSAKFSTSETASQYMYQNVGVSQCWRRANLKLQEFCLEMNAPYI